MTTRLTDLEWGYVSHALQSFDPEALTRDTRDSINPRRAVEAIDDDLRTGGWPGDVRATAWRARRKYLHEWATRPLTEVAAWDKEADRA